MDGLIFLTEGAHLISIHIRTKIQQSMRETHPTSMSSVPRFWEKVYIAVKSKMDDASPFQRKLFQQHALAIGKKRNVEYLGRGRRVPLALELHKFVNKTILSLVRKQIGLDNSNIFPTAGAYVSPEVEEFVHSIGIHMLVDMDLLRVLQLFHVIIRGTFYYWFCGISY